ncbi:hypothetical protein [Niveibacterium terrae]|uniref:hypothetical protein n=1 Tax=Niveibacterium terrae TaxID=3373598 RepID=UPI003A8CB3E8
MNAQKLFAFLLATGLICASLLIVDLVSDGLLSWLFSVQPWGVELSVRIGVFLVATSSLCAAWLIRWRYVSKD